MESGPNLSVRIRRSEQDHSTMVILPQFSLSQTDTHLLVHLITTTNENVYDFSNLSVQRTDDDTIFITTSSDPPIHLLRLPWASRIVGNTQVPWECSRSDNSNELVIQFPKRVPGEEWTDLSVWSQQIEADNIERASAKGTLPPRRQSEETTNQNEPEREESRNLYRVGKYGFARMFSDCLPSDFHDDDTEMLELPWEPEIQSEDSSRMGRRVDATHLDAIHEKRRRRRHEQEQAKFDPDRYLGDWLEAVAEDPLWPEVIAYVPFWVGSQDFISDEEQLLLQQIPDPLRPSELPSVYDLLPGLLDILFAYCYDHVFTMGDPTPTESGWTIHKLSASLSTLEDWMTIESSPDDSNTCSPDQIPHVVYSSLRRSLIYPYWRHLDFGIHVWRHITRYLLTSSNASARLLVRCLLHTRTILAESELYTTQNALFVDPYLTWIKQQQQSNPVMFHEVLQKAAKSINDTLDKPISEIKKALDLDLLRWEQMASYEEPTFDDVSAYESDDSNDGDGDDSANTSSSSCTSSRCDDGNEATDLSNALLHLGLDGR